MNRLESLFSEIKRCIAERSPGDENRLVFGDGSPESRVVLIGEAPGEQEEKLGRPFVGKAGKTLDEFLSLSGVERRDLYITNVVKLRPTGISKAGRIVNRTPRIDEIRLFLPWLVRELDIIAPRIIVTLGNVPLQALTGEKMTIGSVHGTCLSLGDRPLYPLYHPASVIYNRSLSDIYRDDVMSLSKIMKEII